MGEEERLHSSCISAKKEQNITCSPLNRNNNINFSVRIQGRHFPIHQETVQVVLGAVGKLWWKRRWRHEHKQVMLCCDVYGKLNMYIGVMDKILSLYT